MNPTLEQAFQHIDAHQDVYVRKLSESVAIPSVSSDVSLRPKVFEMGKWLQREMESLGITTTLHFPGKHVMEQQELELPPILLGTYGNDAKKKTVLVYGHYDVQPALQSDGWETDPWTLTAMPDGRLVGRGATDDKGPILGWLWVVKTHRELGIPMPVNLKFCFEGMEENGSEGLDELIVAQANDYFKGVDCVCISDNCTCNYIV